jgi:hypothetical protein
MKSWMGLPGLLTCLALAPNYGGISHGGEAVSFENWWDRFTAESVVLTPPRLPAGMAVENVFGAWGVTFSSESATPISGTVETQDLWPSIRPILFLTPLPGPFDAPAILNGPSHGEDVGTLAIRFESPARRVYLVLGGETATTVVVRVVAPSGTVLGELTGQVYGKPQRGGGGPWTPFFLEDMEGREIGRIEVEYLDPAVPEAILLMRVDFVEPPSFPRCVPRIAHGALPEGRTLQTLLSVASSATPHGFLIEAPPQPTAAFCLEFFEEAGAPMPMELDGVVGHEIGRDLAPLESTMLRTTGAVSASGLDAGYACVTSNYPLELAAVYRVLDPNGAPVSEAGIEGVRPGHRFVGVLHKETDGETNTALALANVSDGETTAAVTFLLAPATTFRAEVALPARGHGAWFVDEEQLFPELFGRDAEGTLEIVSDAPIVATILRTIRGVVSASLPLARQRTGLGD